MELQNLNSDDEKLIKFRSNYREKIDGWYNGFLHVFIIYSIGFLLLCFYIMNISALKNIELLSTNFCFLHLI